MRLISATIAAALVLGLAGCSSQDQDKAKQEIHDDAHSAAADAKKAGHEIKEEARELSQKVDAAVKPDSQGASDKLSNGADKVKDAAAKAGVKLDRAALLAKVKTKLASDAGLSTLKNVAVDVDSDGVITLSGTASTQEQKKSAEMAASEVAGVVRVHNMLTVQP